MKKILVFLASSIKEFDYERKVIGDLIRRINDIIVLEDMYVRLVLCEDISSAMTTSRKQEEYNQIIRDSDCFILLCGKELGKYTLEEFEVATESLGTNRGKKDMCVYFFTCDENNVDSDSVICFKNRIKDVDCRTLSVNNLDELKTDVLNMLAKILGISDQFYINDSINYPNGHKL